MADLEEAHRRHGFHALRVREVVRETDDACSLVLDVPDDLQEPFDYRPGQFCTFRVRIGDDEVARCYSMSSAPGIDPHLTVTVKRVPGGAVSNWLNDHAAAGDVLEVTRPSGTFCVQDGERPIIAFCGGSGVTPVMSIAKSVLATSTRPVRLLYANRDRSSVIFDTALQDLQNRHPDRFDLRRHVDADAGYVDAAAVRDLVDGALDADFYLCGPGPFMDLVEDVLLDLGVAPDRIFVERFVTPEAPASEAAAAGPSDPADAPVVAADAGAVPATIVLIVRGKKNEIPYRAGDTVLETARRANVSTPYSCEAGNCATCMALVRVGSVAMRTNDALEPDEVADGWVLTCQSVPTSAELAVEFEPM